MTETSNSNALFERCAALVRELMSTVSRLESASGLDLLGLTPASDREWHRVLRQKLVPQLGAESWLVVAVTGGTNIGKSSIFNHLAGCRASASSPLASGTRHPVCLVPEGFTQLHHLEEIFPDFVLQEWTAASDSLSDAPENCLFWRSAPELPRSLLILDTPDIDSDARINWERADAIRRCSDVLIAVLTQQKYNDAAVKEFFRKAAVEDKSVIVIFNQCLIPEDEPYWPIWLKTFTEETGIHPDAVYLAPADRRAAEDLRLPFYQKMWPVSESAAGTASESAPVPGSLSLDLSQLRFHEIRIRTLLGSLRSLTSEQDGIPSWLGELRRSSRELRDIAGRLSSESALKIHNWPVPASSVFIEAIRVWWQEHQVGWARKVNDVYNTLGAGILWPIQKLKVAIQGETVPPLQDYSVQEWSVILTAVEELFEKLRWISESSTPPIQKKIKKILSGSSRSELIERLRADFQEIDFGQEIREVVHAEMEKFRSTSPDMFTLYRQLNNVTAAVRPVTSVVLFSMGFGPTGEAVAPFVAGAAAQAVVHVVADVAGGATVALAGDAAVATAAGTGSGLLQTWFHRIHTAFTARRAQWLTDRIHSQILGSLPMEVRSAAELTKHPEFRRVETAVQQLRELTASSPGRISHT